MRSSSSSSAISRLHQFTDQDEVCVCVCVPAHIHITQVPCIGPQRPRSPPHTEAKCSPAPTPSFCAPLRPRTSHGHPAGGPTTARASSGRSRRAGSAHPPPRRGAPGGAGALRQQPCAVCTARAHIGWSLARTTTPDRALAHGRTPALQIRTPACSATLASAATRHAASAARGRVPGTAAGRNRDYPTAPPRAACKPAETTRRQHAPGHLSALARCRAGGAGFEI